MSYPQASSTYNNGHYSYIPSNAPTTSKYMTQQGIELIPKVQRRSSPYDPLNDLDPFASMGLYVVPPTQPTPNYLTVGLPAHNSPYRDAHASQHNMSSVPYYPLPPSTSYLTQPEPRLPTSGSRYSPAREAVSLTIDDYGSDIRRPQPAAQYGVPSTSTHDKEHRRHQKSSRSSRRDGIPKDQMQRFRLQDLGSGSSARSKSRLPGSDTQLDANGGKKGKGKAEPSLEEKQIAAKRKREADRQQAYRDGVGSAFDQLHAETYPDEEKSTLVRSDHVKQQCMLDAARQLRALRTEKSVLQEKMTGVFNRNSEKIDSLIAENQAHRQTICQLRQLVVHLREQKRTTTRIET